MSTISRIPKTTELSFDGARQWFIALQSGDLLFHPEDDPADIVRIIDGSRTFADEEADQIREQMAQLEAVLGHEAVIEAAYPIFMETMGF